MEFIKEDHLGGFVKQDDEYPNGDPMTYLPNLWKHMTEMYQLESILDVGSGPGHAVKVFAELGVDAIGIDGCQQAIDMSIAKIYKHDLCDGPYKPLRRFDAIWSCEFLEHVEEQYLDNILQTLNLADKCIYLTAAKPGQGGHHHVNCQPSIYWVEKLKTIYWNYSETLTGLAKAFSRMDHDPNWFSNNGLVFLRD